MLPSHARIVIIGGGAIGCSIAYHLAKLGERDVVLLEKSGLTHGSTWHAAGLVGQLRSKRNLTRLMQHSASLYAKIEADTGQAVEWKPVGSLRLASSKERWSELKRMATTARSFGFALETLSPAEARALFPLITLDGIEGALFIATDGHVDPSSLTQAYAKGARAGGVRIVERVRVTAIEVKDRRATRVRTDKGDIEAEIVVNAAGIWARDVGRLAGIELPAGAVEHQYLVTEKRADIPAGLPTLRDPDKIFYLKPEPGAFAIGGWEADTPTFGETGMPAGFDRELFQPSMERLEAFMLPAAERIPVLNEMGIRTIINGAIPISPDGEPIMGLVPQLDNFYVACGFTSGIAASGGAGNAMAQWIVRGEPEHDLWAFDVRRFGPHHASRRYLAERSVEAYGRYYAMHWPVEEARSARGGRRSPLHQTPRGKARRVRLAQRLGAAELVRARRHGRRRPPLLRGPAELVRRRRRGASRRARARRAHRHELVLEVRDRGRRRACGAAAHRRERPRQAAGRADLHAALQRARRHRGRSHHRASRRGPLLRRHRQRLRRARRRLDRKAPAPRRQRVDARRDLGQGGDQPLRAALARGAR